LQDVDVSGDVVHDQDRGDGGRRCGQGRLRDCPCLSAAPVKSSTSVGRAPGRGHGESINNL
jgi:hypothetical protein